MVECRADRSRKALEADWNRIRRGWYLGDRGFKERLLDQMANLLGHRRVESVGGEAVRARGEQEAEQWIQQALEHLGLEELALRSLPKGADEKLAMAWWLRRHTTLSRSWIAQRIVRV